MDLSTITVADFKAQFRRDFAYLPNYDPSRLYNTGNRVYYSASALFYDALIDGLQGIAPNSDPTKWKRVDDDVDNYVQDADIEAAFIEAQVTFNVEMFSSDQNTKLGYLYLTAHYLVNDLRTSGGGIAGGTAFALASRSVGNVSESYVVPDAYKDNPMAAFFITTGYGAKYLSLIQSRLIGNVFAVRGATRP